MLELTKFPREIAIEESFISSQYITVELPCDLLTVPFLARLLSLSLSLPLHSIERIVTLRSEDMAALHQLTMLGGVLVGFLVLLAGVNNCRAHGHMTDESPVESIARINERGPFLGIVIPNSFEMNPLLQSPSFAPDPKLPHLDIFGAFLSPVIRRK